MSDMPNKCMYCDEPAGVEEGQVDYFKLMKEREEMMKLARSIEDESPEERAMRNPLVLQLIMEKSLPCELKTLRCVNKVCNIESTKELIKRSYLELRLKYYIDQNSFYRDSERALKAGDELVFRPEYSLELLNYWLITKSANLPTTTLTLTGGDWSQPEPSKFLEKIGPTINTLSLLSNISEAGSVLTPTSRQTFCQILTKFAPNVEKLEIDSGFAYSWTDPDQDLTFALPKLHTFVLPSTSTGFRVNTRETLNAIIRAAPNLKIIENMSALYMSLIVSLGKVQAVQELKDFGDLISVSLDDHVKFAAAQPVLRKLGVCDSFGRAQHVELIEALYKIFNSSQTTLEELEIETMSMFRIQAPIKIPSLNRLQTLKLGILRTLHEEVHFRRPRMYATLNGVYPSLEKLSLGYCDWRMLFQTHLNNTPVFQNVKFLEIQDTTDEAIVRNLATFCPNVKTLHLISIQHSHICILEIFTHFQNLDEFVMKFSWKDYDQFDLDSVLTGLEGSVCDSHFSKNISTFDALQQRRLPWLGSIEGLKTLKIYFAELKNRLPKYLTDSRQIPLLTRVSGRCAFDQLPNLSVTVGYSIITHRQRLDEAFHSVAPHVTLVQYNKNVMNF